MRVRLLQFSDAHLDASFASSALDLPPAKRDARAREAREGVKRALELAPARQVDAVLVPGDLWDDEAVTADTVAYLGEAFEAVRPIPVFIAPGNHDYYAPGSGYDPHFLTSRGLKPWPDNVHVFTSGTFETVDVPELPGVTVTGRAFRANVASSERLLAGRIGRPRAELALGVLHGSRIGYEGGKKLITAPFNDAELLGQGFAWTALGHYHEGSLIEDARGRIRAAYTGSLLARSLNETGPRGCLIFEVDDGGLVPGTLEFVEIDPRRVVRVVADVTGVGHAESALGRVRAAIEEAKARPQDQVYAWVTGRYPRGLEPPGNLLEALEESWQHVRVAWEAEPDYDVEELARREAHTVEARFAREILDRLARARTPRERAVLKEALYLGLDAVTQGRVQVHPEPFWERAANITDELGDPVTPSGSGPGRAR